MVVETALGTFLMSYAAQKGLDAVGREVRNRVEQDGDEAAYQYARKHPETDTGDIVKQRQEWMQRQDTVVAGASPNTVQQN